MRHILVMGICGTGKSTVAGLLADRMARPLVEADTYHSQDAVAAMSRGEALTDDHRWDWLDRVADAAAGQAGSVIACSALKRAYRARLEDRLGPLDVVFLHGTRALIEERMSSRTNHYMPASLIDSQLADLEPPQGPDVLPLDIAEPLDRTLDAAHQFATRPRADARAD